MNFSGLAGGGLGQAGGLSRAELISVWALSVLALAILFLTREIEPVVVAAALIGIAAASILELRSPLPKMTWLQNSMILAAFAYSSYRFFATKTAFLLIVADFLTFFLLLKLFFKKDRDDLLQIIALSFFVLLSASTLALDFSFLFGFIFYIWLAAWTLSLHTLAGPAEVGQSGSGPTAPDLTGLYPFARRNAWITLAIVVIFSIGIFVFFPRLSLAVFQGAFLNPAHQSGYNESVNLRKSGAIRESENLVMRVEIDPEQKNKISAGYLRGHALSYFDGLGWNSSGGPSGGKKSGMKSGVKPLIQKMVKNHFSVAGPDTRMLMNDFGMTLSGRSYIAQDIYLESIGHSTLFGLAWMSSIEAKIAQVHLSDDYSARRPAGATGRIHYKVKSLFERPNEAALIRQSKAAPPDLKEMEKDLQLPDMHAAPFQKLLSQIVSRRDSPYAKARKIEQHLRNNFRYNLTIRPKNLDRPLESFLFEDKQGQCEYFASAMAVLLRMEKIPARIVNGFVMQEWNAKGNYFVVRAKDAHTWVEAYMGGLWTEFDPSPIVQMKQAEEFSLWKEARERLEHWNFLWTAYVLGYDMESQKAIAGHVELKSARLSAAVDRAFESWRKNLLGKTVRKSRSIDSHSRTDRKEFDPAKIFVYLLCLMTIFGVLGGMGVYIKRRKKQSLLRKAQAGFYFELLRILARKGWVKKPSETPSEFCRRLEQNWPEFKRISASAHNLNRIFCGLRYGGQPAGSPTLKAIELEMKAIKSSINNFSLKS